ncbi:ATP synthase F1 subunit epsilon [Paludicola sp. MB14-C6]|uniref:ATP synthase F1 subunit epsilon n=1 Tax=Paludihabitans sp. MB14-C6 TaxID=3070656 RepID=UPI0027DAB9D8|nr:ATP synthase F1 subunit epsilon [Paludicola sp. MB14-C6]WMJ21820.1 ATP synthase F1 subunit epsilon [Paludicola sp. MB14-C6]
MSTFSLKVVTPERELLNEEVSRVIVRTTSGDIGILKGHANYIAPLEIGRMRIQMPNGEERIAAIAGGMIKVDEHGTTILTNMCEWKEEINLERAKKAEQKARYYLDHPTQTHTIEIATLKLKRALNRINIFED